MTVTKRITLTAVLAMPVVVLAVAQAFAQDNKDLSVDEIVDRANRVAYYQGTDGRAKVLMTITDARGQTRKREFSILRWDQPKEGVTDDSFCGEQKFYVYFEQPADVNKMAFLVWKHLDKDDDRWLYLPGLDLVKRIAATDKRTSFVGSHFLYEDVSGRNIDADTHEMQESSATYYVLKSTPKDPGSVEFKYYVNWIHRKTFVVIKTVYYDQDDKPYRTYQALKFASIQGYPTITKSQMTDTKMGGNTVLEYRDVRYNASVPENVFQERRLKNPPLDLLK